MAIHKALKTRDDINSVHVTRKVGRRGFAGIKDCEDGAMQGLEEHISKSKERLITVANNSNNNSNNLWTSRKNNKKCRKSRQKNKNKTVWLLQAIY